MLRLIAGQTQGIEIHPRWPSSAVYVDPDAFARLQEVQVKLPADVQLILTRGYEPSHTNLDLLRRASRLLGVRLFRLIYPARRAEIADIFGSNGHDADGTHIDVSITVRGRRIRFLRLGVFTPRAWQNSAVKMYQPYVNTVKEALQSGGFSIHRNETESLQIHCDLIKK